MFCYNETSCLTPTTGTAPNTFSRALGFFAATTCLIPDDPYPDAYVCDSESFDFIIVGGGTAGCVVANRLSENKQWKILLIEAGYDPPVESKIPAQNAALFQTKYDWGYKTTYDGVIDMATKGGNINWPRGKTLGGTSNLNGMLYIRGNRHDFQHWCDDGNKEWNPDVIYKYYKKLESLQNVELLKIPEIRQAYGLNGPLIINRVNSTYRPLTEKILSSWDEIGIKKVTDLNTANVLGSGISLLTAYNGVRASSDRMYLNPAKNRPNLTILKGALVIRILINVRTKVAYGVKIELNGKKKTLLASREVIICAGTINTVQVLMLSGVGPKEQLRSLNIDCIVDLPGLGQNLQDQCNIPITIFGEGPSEKTEAERDFDSITYLYNRTGDLAQNSFADILAFYSNKENATYPDYQNHLSILWRNSSTIRQMFSRDYNYEDSIVDHLVELNKNYTLYAFLFNLLHPLSRGNITLKSKDPKENPLIYPNYFHNQKDLDAAVVGIKKITQIINSKYFRSINAFLGRIESPACNKFKLNSKGYWKCVCKIIVFTIYHPVGTAKMGPKPSTAVVDCRLRVHKMKGLRIIDGSVMPTITSGNTQAPIYMIAERGSDLVKEDHK